MEIDNENYIYPVTTTIQSQKKIPKAKKVQPTSRVTKPAGRNWEKLIANQIYKTQTNSELCGLFSFSHPLRKMKKWRTASQWEVIAVIGWEAHYLQVRINRSSLKLKMIGFISGHNLSATNKKQLCYLSYQKLLELKVIGLLKKKSSWSKWQKIKIDFRLAHFLIYLLLFLYDNF